MAVPAMSMAAQPPPTVPLGTTSSFAVLAGSTITNTGTTNIGGNAGGDIGLSPGSAFTDQGHVTTSGAIHLADVVAGKAKKDLTAAYLDAAGRTTTEDLTGQDLGGLTLTPGVYEFDSSAQLTGILTLDGLDETDPVFIFKIGSTLTTASSSNFNLIRGARYCRTFWQVGSSATLGTDSNFVGHIFALTTITATTGATVQGQLLARNGAVTLDTNTITNGFCGALQVTKAVSGLPHGQNPPDFVITITGQSPKRFNALNGWTQTWDNLTPGKYTVTEGTLGTGWTTETLPSGSITVLDGATATATVTNTYTPSVSHHSNGGGQSPQIYPPLINVIKTPEPLALTSGQGSVTYTYKVTNPGMVELSNVSVTDDKVSPVSYVSGDVNADNLLQPNETWIYTSKMNLNATTTNTATANGSANGMAATDIAFATVVVTPLVVVTPTIPSGEVVTPTITGGEVVTPTVTGGEVVIPTITGGEVVTRTVTGGQIPKTSTPLYELLFIGAVLTLVGAVGWRSRKRYE